MQVPIEITFRHIGMTEALDRTVRELAAKLERYCDHIQSCRVAVERPNAHPTSGSGYRVRIDLMVPPGHEVVIRREADEGLVTDDLYKVLHDAFHAAERKLKKLNSKQRGLRKSHPEHDVQGVVGKLFEDYGFISTIDGREIYFHKNSVVNENFDELKVGFGVAFVEEEGDEGPQASTVRIVDHRGGRPSESELERTT